MSSGLKEAAKAVLATSMKVVTAVLYVLKLPYWAVVGLIIRAWGRTGLHSITVGQLTGGAGKTRSAYREEMLLKAMLLYVNLKDKSCLDLACNDGFWSFRLARFGLKDVTGIDLSAQPIAKANFLKVVYDFPKFQFRRQDIYDLLYGTNGKSYDIVLLLSILYHLPANTDWRRFFGAIARINNDCLLIDSRWFEDDAYWYDKTSREQAMIETSRGPVAKWRPVRKDLCGYLHESGYDRILEINPSALLRDPKAAYGNGDPYTLENVSDYITGHRTLMIAYKENAALPNVADLMQNVTLM